MSNDVCGYECENRNVFKKLSGNHALECRCDMGWHWQIVPYVGTRNWEILL